MAGPVAERSYRLPPYSGTAVASLRLGVLVALSLMASGCAMTGGLGGFVAKSKSDEAQVQAQAQTQAEAEVHAQALANDDSTASTSSPTLRASAVVTDGLPSETDLVFARMAIVEVLKRGSKEVSAPWENPSSGARGTVTPIASAYARDSDVCHDFLASYVRRGTPERWLQGQACRSKARGKQGSQAGVWEVRTMRPWTRS
jgi:hypothetical protein